MLWSSEDTLLLYRREVPATHGSESSNFTSWIVADYLKCIQQVKLSRIWHTAGWMRTWTPQSTLHQNSLFYMSEVSYLCKHLVQRRRILSVTSFPAHFCLVSSPILICRSTREKILQWIPKCSLFSYQTNLKCILVSSGDVIKNDYGIRTWEPPVGSFSTQNNLTLFMCSPVK